jgi:hypothetical protein
MILIMTNHPCLWVGRHTVAVEETTVIVGLPMATTALMAMEVMATTVVVSQEVNPLL